jgi:hypothetical protein
MGMLLWLLCCFDGFIAVAKLGGVCIGNYRMAAEEDTVT